MGLRRPFSDSRLSVGGFLLAERIASAVGCPNLTGKVRSAANFHYHSGVRNQKGVLIGLV